MKHREPEAVCLNQQHGKWMAVEAELVQGHSLVRRFITFDEAQAKRVAQEWANDQYTTPGSVDHAGWKWKLENCGKAKRH